MSRGRLPLAVLLAAAGTLVGHQLAYTLFHGHPGGAADHAHGYLTLVGGTVVPLALVGAVCLLALRSGRASLPSAPLLVTAQVVGFLGQEVLERLAAGVAVADVIGNPAVMAGVTAQVVIAPLVLAVVRVARLATGRLLVSRAPQAWELLAVGAAPPAPTTRQPLAHVPVGPILRRGPPVLLAP